MSDLIDRQAAIDMLKNRWKKTRNYEGIGDDIAEECELYLKQVPSAQPETNCSEIPNNSDTIYRQDAIDAIYHHLPSVSRTRARTMLHEVPSVQPERKTAKWNFIGYNMFECTCCGTAYTTQQLNGLRNYNTDPYAPKFCPNCGADMRGTPDDQS